MRYIKSAPEYYDGTSAERLCARFNTMLYFSDNIDILFQYMFGGDNNYISYDKKGSYKGLYTAFLIDINGTKSKPNVLGKDFFIFLMDKSGQILVPGSSQYAWLMNDDESKYSSTSSEYTCNETNVGSGVGCAGSIFENNLKVIYQ